MNKTKLAKLSREDAIRNYASCLATAKEEGVAEGAAQERAKADEEKKAKAKKMLADGLSCELVSKYSGLSIEEVEKLK